ncbi:MAG: hypothetical protein V1781_08685 [Bacteroidota bacterium]
MNNSKQVNILQLAVIAIKQFKIISFYPNFIRIWICFLLLFLSSLWEGQERNLFAQPMSKSQFRQMFTEGNLMMMEQFYDTAVKTFLHLYRQDPSNAHINYKIGVCYFNIPAEKSKAIPYLENALIRSAGKYREDDPSEKNAPEDMMFYLGKAYHFAYRFDDAIAQFQKFRNIVSKRNLAFIKEIDHCIEMSNYAKELVAKPVDCTIVNLGDNVNSEFSDYGPVITADESMLIFTSRREGAGGVDNKTIYDAYFEDIWICNADKYGTWTKSESISKSINTDYNEATTGISADGQLLFVYRDDEGSGNIYISKLDGDYWTATYKLADKKINSDDWEPSACISADGQTLYFVSTRQGGYGGRDIYQCSRLPNGGWSAPENMGNTINTPYDEDAPFIHPDGTTFFFSSNGHKSMGGFDIFYSTKVSKNAWTEPINVGFPINTTDDDIYFVTSSDGKRAYYASTRPEGIGEKDIYMASMAEPLVKPVAILTGHLKTIDGSPIPSNILVTITKENGEKIPCKPNTKTGKFIQPMLPGQEYELTVESNAKKVYDNKFFLPQDSSYLKLLRPFFQKDILIGDTTSFFSQLNVPKSDTSSHVFMTSMEGKVLLSQNPKDTAKNVMLHLLNSSGNLIQSTITKQKGKFKFENIPSDKKYIIRIDENDSIVKTKNALFLADNDNNIIAANEIEGKFFLFKNIPTDLNSLKSILAKDTIQMLTTMTGKIVLDNNKEVSNVKIHLIDENGKIIQTKKSDKTGTFAFENISTEKNYTIRIDEEDPILKKGNNLYLANSNNQLVRVISKVGNYFVFKNLPADLNKLNAMFISNDISMKGKLLLSSNLNNGAENVEIYLLDNKNNVLYSTKTGTGGIFLFENLSSEEQYIIKINANDTALASIKKLYLANNFNKIVRIIRLTKKGFLFENLPADISRLAEIKEGDITTEFSVLNYVSSDDKNFDFVMYFSYNKKEIDTSLPLYLTMIEKILKVINEKGKANIIIESSASTVPTKTYKNNDSLSGLRGNEAQHKIHSSINWKNIDLAKICYKIDTKVQGPAYKNDAVKNRSIYERWQYVKVIVQ